MKNFLIFIAGMGTMFILLLIIGMAINLSSNSGYPGLTLFEKEGTCVSKAKKIKVFQTLEPDMALAHTQINSGSYVDFDDTLILLLGDENTHFYDEQKIIIPSSKCAKQVGTYQYEAKNGIMKTVPAIIIK